MKISVVLTSYNHEKFIRQSIESVLNQTYRNFELIISDDCSIDASWDIISEYKAEHPEIITIRGEHNTAGEIHKDVIKNYTTGDYIALHHSDDVWCEDKLQKQIDILQKMPECVAVFTNVEAIDDDGDNYVDKSGFYYDLFSVENRTRQEWLNYFFYHGNCLCHPSILINKSVYIDDGFSRKGLRQIPDFVKWIQVCKKHEIYVLPEKLVKFRVHKDGGNTSGVRSDTKMRSATEMFLMLKEYASIQDKEEFLRIFPNARKYCMGKFFLTEYVFGRMCMEEGMPPYARLFGVQLLFDVLNDSRYADLIAEEYHYTSKEFMYENGKYDIFGIVPKAFEQTRSIYYDAGNGFSSENVVIEKYTLDNSDTFQAWFIIDLAEGESLKGLRFDPAEGVMIKANISRTSVNQEDVKCIGENAICQIEGKDIFVTLDPIYNISLPAGIDLMQHIEVNISGKIERLTDDEMAHAVTLAMSEKRDIENELNRIRGNKLYRAANKMDLI